MPETDPEVERKAQRHLFILYAVMVLLVVLPFILLWFKRHGPAH